MLLHAFLWSSGLDSFGEVFQGSVACLSVSDRKVSQCLDMYGSLPKPTSGHGVQHHQLVTSELLIYLRDGTVCGISIGFYCWEDRHLIVGDGRINCSERTCW